MSFARTGDLVTCTWGGVTTPATFEIPSEFQPPTEISLFSTGGITGSYIPVVAKFHRQMTLEADKVAACHGSHSWWI